MSADRMSVLRVPVGPAAVVAYTGTAGSITQTMRGSSVLVWSTTDAYICSGATATATNGTPLPAFTPVWLPLPSTWNVGDGAKIVASAIQISAGGNLYAQQFE
jgi:hypothetical protein